MENESPRFGGTLRVYKGVRGADGVAYVYVSEAGRPDHLLSPRTDLFTRSSAGLDWGYYGNGPAQCALAIVADALGDDLRAVRVHSGFHFRTIAALPRHLSWQLTQAQVLAIVEDIEQNFPEEE
jgi:hypothetical protein